MAVQTKEVKLRAALIKAREALHKWDGANDENRYADKFVWEAFDVIRNALKEDESI